MKHRVLGPVEGNSFSGREMINCYLSMDLTCAAPLTQVESANAAQEMKFLPRPTRTEYNPLDTTRLALSLIGDSFLSVNLFTACAGACAHMSDLFSSH